MIELTAEEAADSLHFREYLASSGVLEFTTQCACPRSWRQRKPSKHAFKRLQYIKLPMRRSPGSAVRGGQPA